MYSVSGTGLNNYTQAVNIRKATTKRIGDDNVRFLQIELDVTRTMFQALGERTLQTPGLARVTL